MNQGKEKITQLSKIKTELIKRIRRSIITRSVKRLSGYYIINPYESSWTKFPAHRMKYALEEIVRASKIQLPFEKLIEHGCGNGKHYAKMLKQFTRHLIGVDIMEEKLVENTDEYYKVSENIEDNYFKTIESNSIEAVVVLASVGMNMKAIEGQPHSAQWIEYLGNYKNRQGRYFSPNNYPRIIKPGGYLIVLEWEAFPELRFGKHIKREEIESHLDKYYPHPQIEQFQFIAKGFSSEQIGPFIVYQKMG